VIIRREIVLSAWVLLLHAMNVSISIILETNMANYIVQWAKRMLPAVYIILQIIILLVLYILEAGNLLYLLLALNASAAYLWTAIADVSLFKRSQDTSYTMNPRKHLILRQNQNQ
jgi:hypothetical protein